MMWFALIKRYWQVSLLRETPEHTPCSILLLSIIAAIFFFLVVVQWLMADSEALFTLNTAILAAGTLVLSYGLYTVALLSVFSVSHRTVQSLSCLLAGHAIVHILAFPLLLFAPFLIKIQLPPLLGLLLGITYLICTFVLSIWQFIISVHIYKNALSITYFPAALASFGLIACNILIVSLWR